MSAVRYRRNIFKISNTSFDDEGRYWCEVQEEHTLEKDEGYLYLNVADPVQVTQIPQLCQVEIYTDSDIVRSLTGLETILHCAYTTSCDEQTLYWFKGTLGKGEQRILTERNGNVETEEDIYGLVGQACLQIHAVSRSDQSIYTCQVSSFGAEDGIVQVDLTVTDPVKPKINTLELTPTVAIENDDVTIKCNSTGLPPPTYSWLLNESPLPDEERYQLSESDSKITITNVKGQITCQCIHA
ncbi:cell adhesion molecule 1-like [Ptychodera flava]|uniref:cell adhesion molecule 1-like n=1 Tax=Ptychodera flava TaxID=63121 RepID=UPI00396A71DF